MILIDEKEDTFDGDDSSEFTFTDWDNEPTIKKLKEDVEEASSSKSSHVNDVDTWLDNLNITGKAKRKAVEGRSGITPKLIRKQAEWRYASLSEPFLSTDDLFNVDPVTFEDKDAARQNGLVLNNQFNTKIKKNKFIDEYIRTAVDEGTVIVRIGWELEEVEKLVPDFDFHSTDDPEEISKLSSISNKLQEDPSFLNTLNPEIQKAYNLSIQNNSPIIAVRLEDKIEIVTVKNQPDLEIIDYNNISIDPTAKGDIDKASFVNITFDSSISQLEKDGKYKNLDNIRPGSTSVLDDPEFESSDDSNFEFKDKARKKLIIQEYWGFWDINGDNVLKPIVVAFTGDTIIRMELNPYPDQKLPFVVVQYLPVRRSMYGQPDGELLKDNQDIIGAVTRGMIDIMGRSANGQMGMSKSALDVTNRRKFMKGQHYDINPGVNAQQSFFMHTYPEIPNSAQFMLASQNADAESLTGVKAFSTGSGISGNALGGTATGIRSALDATSKRELGILRRFAEGIKQIGRKIISMNSEFLNETEIVRITNDEFVSIRKDDLQGNFDLRLGISTAEADNSKAEELSFMLQTTAQSSDPEEVRMIRAEIARLRKMPDLAKKIEEFKPAPDPIAQAKGELEIELLKAKIANENAKANENNANANLDNAKASNISSDTDQKNLDFLDQESGLKQERDLQKQGEQARNNILLENQKFTNKIAEGQLNLNQSNF